jgi:hypothetical protein
MEKGSIWLWLQRAGLNKGEMWYMYFGIRYAHSSWVQLSGVLHGQVELSQF